MSELSILFVMALAWGIVRDRMVKHKRGERW